MEKIQLEYAFEGNVAFIRMDDGKGNILDHVMIEEMQQALESFREMPHLKLIVFESAGKHFSFGASVEEHQREYAAAMLQQLHKLFYTIKELSIPTAAKISGQCLGGGLELALMCNFIFADKSARLGQPEIMLGVFPPAGSLMLPEKIGFARAEELLITGRTFTAGEGHMIGLVNYVFEDRTDLDEGLNAWIEKYILPKSASSLRYAVGAARIRLNHVFSNFMPLLESQYAKMMETHDANEGILSFLEKRQAVWTDQ